MFGKKLRELRKIEGWTQEEVAKKLGISKQTYSNYENEKRRPSLSIIRELASIYNVNIDDIFAEEAGPFAKLPIVGTISCGNGTIAYEDIEGYEEVPKSWIKGGEYIFLRAKGDSMINARIQDGDLLLIKRQDDVENGEIAAVVIDDEAVLKRVYKNNGTVILQSENPEYQPILLKEKDMKNIRIIGKLKKVILNF